MAITKVPAHDFIFEVETGVADTFVAIEGINSMGIERVKNDADGTDFDSGAWEEHQPMRRGKTLTLEAFYKEDVANMDRGPGQERVEELAELDGPDALVPFKITFPSGRIETWPLASFDAGGPSGGNDDLASWSCTVRLSGAPDHTQPTP